MKTIASISLFICISLAGCTKNTTGTVHQLALPANSQALTDATGKFAFRLFANELKANPDKNILISPLSIYMAFSMVYNGADHATLDSMRKALQLDDLSAADLNQYCKALIEQLPMEDSKVSMSIANSVWYNNAGVQPIPDFLHIANTYFDADVIPLNFSVPSAAQTINDWANEKTKGKIDKVIDAISPDDLMYLVNAIYFKGNWKNEFKQSDTHKDNFFPSSGESVSVDFMQRTDTVNVAETDSFEIAELPYGSGKTFSMYVVLPKSGRSIANLMSGFGPSEFGSAVGKMTSAKVNMIIPKWTCSFTMEDLRQQLSVLGMSNAFAGDADLSNMYTQPAYISKAIHKTNITVDEKGTEAAAVSVVGISFTSFGPPPFKSRSPVYVCNCGKTKRRYLVYRPGQRSFIETIIYTLP